MSEITLKDIHNDLDFLKKKVSLIEGELGILMDYEPEVRAKYLEKLRKIEKEKGKVFDSKDDFLNYLQNEI